MTPEHLLPANASIFEQELSRAMDVEARLALPAEALRTFKTHPNADLLPWLIWEYGLGELLPYLPDPRRAIAEGILWQRLRGTPAALSTALAWIGATATVEQEPPGLHFAEFQLDPGQVLDSDTAIANLIAIARLSAPVRSRLSRLYHGYDLRRVVLDESRLGEALLSDHSGVVWPDGVTRLSFGRGFARSVKTQDQTIALTSESIRFGVAHLVDRYQLDFSALGDTGHTRNEEILHSHLFTLGNAHGVRQRQTLLPVRQFCKAMVVLSDSTPLGDINACTPRFTWQEIGGTLVLDSGDPLSATVHTLVRVEVLERLLRTHPASVITPTVALTRVRQRQTTHRVQARADQALGQWVLGESVPSFDQGFLRREHTRHNEALPDAAGWQARLYQKAQIVLSDSMPLGDINANLSRFVWQESGQSISLGGGEPLSATLHRLIRVEVLERLLRTHQASAVTPSVALASVRHRQATHRVHARADQTLGMWTLGESVPSLDRGFLRREHTRGNRALPDAAGWQARLYQKAQIVLGDAKLGDLNSRTPRAALLRTRSVPTLGTFSLGDRAAFEWLTLTEMHARVSGIEAAEPYAFAMAPLSLHRVLTQAADADTGRLIAPSRATQIQGDAVWQGQTWTGVRWPASTWQATREVIGSRHLTQTE